MNRPEIRTCSRLRQGGGGSSLIPDGAVATVYQVQPQVGLSIACGDDSAVGVAPADVLQQVGQVPGGTCAVRADARLNWAGVPDGHWAYSWAQWANGGAGGPVCTRTLFYDVNTAKRAIRAYAQIAPPGFHGAIDSPPSSLMTDPVRYEARADRQNAAKSPNSLVVP